MLFELREECVQLSPLVFKHLQKATLMCWFIQCGDQVSQCARSEQAFIEEEALLGKCRECR